jgi:hypothetical protein
MCGLGRGRMRPRQVVPVYGTTAPSRPHCKPAGVLTDRRLAATARGQVPNGPSRFD